MDQLSELLEDVARRAAAYRGDVHDSPIRPEPGADLTELTVPFPDAGSSAEEVIELLDRVVVPATLGETNPRFFGWVIGSAYPVGLAADWLTSAWDQNTATFDATPGAVMIESTAIEWVKQATGLPESAAGAFVTGTTAGNATAIAAARTSVLDEVGWDSVSQGLFGAPPITVIVGDEVHPSLIKGLGVTGLGRERVVRVPVDDRGRMRADVFPEIDGPTIVCLQAGNVNTGAFDPFAEIIPLANESGAWVHVDGAFGFWAAASPRLAHLTEGMELADSWATDCHKYLNVPYDAGLVLSRQAASLERVMSVAAPYLLEGQIGLDPFLYTIEMSRRARGIPTYAVLRHLGREGLAELIDRTAFLARMFASELEHAGFEILNEVVLNQVLVSFGSPELTHLVIQETQAEGVMFAGPTVWQGHTAMRISVSGYETSEEDVMASVAAMVRAASSAK